MLLRDLSAFAFFLMNGPKQTEYAISLYSVLFYISILGFHFQIILDTDNLTSCSSRYSIMHYMMLEYGIQEILIYGFILEYT